MLFPDEARSDGVAAVCDAADSGSDLKLIERSGVVFVQPFFEISVNPDYYQYTSASWRLLCWMSSDTWVLGEQRDVIRMRGLTRAVLCLEL
jgi:hypothetical protein